MYYFARAHISQKDAPMFSSCSSATYLSDGWTYSFIHPLDDRTHAWYAMGMHVPPIRHLTLTQAPPGEIQVQVIQVMTSCPTSILCGCWIGGACDSPRARRSLLHAAMLLDAALNLRPLPCSVVRHMQTQQTRPPIFSPAQSPSLILKRLFPRVEKALREDDVPTTPCGPLGRPRRRQRLRRR